MISMIAYDKCSPTRYSDAMLEEGGHCSWTNLGRLSRLHRPGCPTRQLPSRQRIKPECTLLSALPIGRTTGYEEISVQVRPRQVSSSISYPHDTNDAP